MHKPPDLTMETFRTLAVQAGFDPNDPHLEELFPQVKLMLDSVAVLEQANVTGVEPPPFDAAAGWDTAESGSAPR